MRAKFMAIQAAGYLVLLGLIYEWLGIGDRSGLQVLLSAALGAAIVFVALWLIAKALDHEFTLRRLPRFLPWMIAVAAAIGACLWLGTYRSKVGLSVASHLTLWFRKPVKPETVGSVYAALVWMAGIAAVLGLLPFASAAAEGTKRRVRDELRQWRYWVGCAVMLAAGCFLPGWLIGWVPKFSGLGAQTASWIVRFSLAYVIALAAWLEIAWLARRFRSAATA
jgi:hypothetical protein